MFSLRNSPTMVRIGLLAATAVVGAGLAVQAQAHTGHTSAPHSKSGYDATGDVRASGSARATSADDLYYAGFGATTSEIRFVIRTLEMDSSSIGSRNYRFTLRPVAANATATTNPYVGPYYEVRKDVNKTTGLYRVDPARGTNVRQTACSIRTAYDYAQNTIRTYMPRSCLSVYKPNVKLDWTTGVTRGTLSNGTTDAMRNNVPVYVSLP